MSGESATKRRGKRLRTKYGTTPASDHAGKWRGKRIENSLTSSASKRKTGIPIAVARKDGPQRRSPSTEDWQGRSHEGAAPSSKDWQRHGHEGAAPTAKDWQRQGEKTQPIAPKTGRGRANRPRPQRQRLREAAPSSNYRERQGHRCSVLVHPRVAEAGYGVGRRTFR